MKRIAALLVTVLLLLLLIPWLWHYYHTGTVIITTNSPYNTITLTRTNKDKSSKTSDFKARGKLSVTTASGEYSITVDGNSVATVQTFELKPRQTARYNINPINTTGVEPVTYKEASSLVATDDQLVYLNSTNNWLYKIDEQNNLTNINNSQLLQTAKWVSPSFGIGQDSDGHLYSISNGLINPLQVPFSYDGKPVNFDVSPDKRIYVSYGAAVYVGNRLGNFKKIYTATSSSPTLAAGTGQVAVSDTRFGPRAGNITKPLLATISTSGKESKKNVEAEQLAWSPDGKLLATVNQTNPTIYDAALRTATTTPSAVITQLKWLSGSVLLYSTNGQLWTYTMSAKKAQLLANMPLDSSITGIYPSSSYIYVTTLGSTSDTNSHAIRRISLRGRPVPDYIYNLQDILPENTGRSVVGLINFSLPPTILVQVYPNAPPGDYIQQTRAQLQGQGFDINQLQFQLGKPVFSD